jgi:hypothetical protein
MKNNKTLPYVSHSQDFKAAVTDLVSTCTKMKSATHMGQVSSFFNDETSSALTSRGSRCDDEPIKFGRCDGSTKSSLTLRRLGS